MFSNIVNNAGRITRLVIKYWPWADLSRTKPAPKSHFGNKFIVFRNSYYGQDFREAFLRWDLYILYPSGLLDSIYQIILTIRFFRIWRKNWISLKTRTNHSENWMFQLLILIKVYLDYDFLKIFFTCVKLIVIFVRQSGK